VLKEDFIKMLESAWDHVNNCVEEEAVHQVADMAFGGLIRSYGNDYVMDKIALLAAAEAKLMEMCCDDEDDELDEDDCDCENCEDKDTCESSTVKPENKSKSFN